MPSLSDLLNMGKQYVKDAMPGGLLNPEVNRQDILDGAALSTTAVPVLGDLLGLGADINRYATDPESRTAGNFALSGLGMLPFVPAMVGVTKSIHPDIIRELGDDSPEVLASKAKGLLTTNLNRARSFSERLGRSDLSDAERISLNTQLGQSEQSAQKLLGWLRQLEPPQN